MADKRNNRVVVQLTEDRLANEAMIADALVRSDLDLFNIEGRATLVRDGELVKVTDLELQKLVSAVVATKTVIRNSAGKAEVVLEPVVLDQQMIRGIQTGTDLHPRTGGEVRGGKLADRLPKVDAASVGLAV